MGKIATIVSHLKLLASPAKMEEKIIGIIRKEEATIVDMNTLQLMSGKDSLGVFLDPPYRSVNYAEMKLHLNPAGVVDLKLTGAFHDGFYVRANRFPVMLDSHDAKTPMLREKYGDNIFGLQKQNVSSLAHDYILPELQGYLRGIIHV